jgi:hypothetical protein
MIGAADRGNKRGEIHLLSTTHPLTHDTAAHSGEYSASRHLHRSDPDLPGGKQCVHQRGHEHLRRAGFHVPPTVKTVPAAAPWTRARLLRDLASERLGCDS